MTEIILPKLPALSFLQKEGHCYARTYKNVWEPSKKDPTKMQAVKRNVKNVGVINSSDGLGVLHFYPEFIDSNPQLRLNEVIVSRVLPAGSVRPKLQIKPKDPLKEFRTLLPITTRKCGLHMVVEKLLRRDPLLSSLQFVFPDEWQACLAIAEFMISNPDARMQNFECWHENNENFLDSSLSLSSSSISKLFKKITPVKILQFFADYFDRLESGLFYHKERFWALDSTNFGCYGKNLSNIAWGKPKEAEGLPQLNVMMLVDQDTQRPLFYKHFNGSIPDVSTVKEMADTAIQLGARSFVLVFDRGYYGKDNLNEICSLGYHFLCCVPLAKTVQFNEEIAAVSAQLVSGTCYDNYCEQSVVSLKKRYKTAPDTEREFFVHIFYDPEEAGSQIAYILKKRSDIAQILKQKKQLSGYSASFAKRFLITNDDGSIQTNNSAFQQASNHAGMFVILSDTVHSAGAAYKAYKARKTVEEVFSSTKARMKMKRMRVSSEESLDGKCFIQFIATSIWMMMDGILDHKRAKKQDIPHNSLRYVIRELNNIGWQRFNNNYKLYPAISKSQRNCLALFGCRYPVSGYDTDVPLANRRQQAGKPHGWKK